MKAKTLINITPNARPPIVIEMEYQKLGWLRRRLIWLIFGWEVTVEEVVVRR